MPDVPILDVPPALRVGDHAIDARTGEIGNIIEETRSPVDGSLVAYRLQIGHKRVLRLPNQLQPYETASQRARVLVLREEATWDDGGIGFAEEDDPDGHGIPGYWPGVLIGLLAAFVALTVLPRVW